MSVVEGFAFGPYQLDTRSKRLLRDDQPVAVSPRQVDLLRVLLARAGQIISKDALIEAAWPEVAVTDNSLEQAISSLRRLLDGPAGGPYIETHARRGYRFAAPVTRLERRESDAALDALLAPHRAWTEGRAALETLERAQILRAREAFERVLASVPEQASVHVGLANACAMQFEMTRADRPPDTAALELSAHHAREACRLDPRSAEAWATLGFVLERVGNRTDAIAALRRAVSLEPDNWRHHIRLSYGGWGEERLRAARRTLQLLPGLPLAHWLAATVHVARLAFPEAERELEAGILFEQQQGAAPRFSGVALHWLSGLIRLARGDEEGAMRELERELALESSGHLYARECCANAWYAIGAVHLRRGRRDAARGALTEAAARVPMHPMAHAGLAALSPDRPGASPPVVKGLAADTDMPAGLAMAHAATLVLGGRTAEAASLIEQHLSSAPDGSAAWTLPVDPLLDVESAPEVWATALARLRSRAL